MNNFTIRIKVPEGQIEEILERLTAAQEEIRKCYQELNMLGVLTIEKDTLDLSDDEAAVLKMFRELDIRGQRSVKNMLDFEEKNRNRCWSGPTEEV